MDDAERALREEVFDLVRKIHGLRRAGEGFEPGKTPVRYAGRVYDEQEMVNLVDSSLDFWLTAGRYAEEFESGFAQYLGLSEAILVNSGSSANLVAISALTSPQLGERRLKPGDEVITTAAGFPSTLGPIVQNNLVPVFVDVDIGTYNAIPDRVQEAVGPMTRAIFLPHTLGNPFDVERMLEIAGNHNLWLIEDNCDALGSEYTLSSKGKTGLTGTFGHIATSSFYPAHHITMGEGGCVVTDDPLLARIARSFRDWGRDCYCSGGQSDTCRRRFSRQFGTLPYGYDHKYVYSHIGYNLKLTDMQAAIGVAQMDKLEGFVKKRRENFAHIERRLSIYPDRLILPKTTEKSAPSWFGFPMTVAPGAGFTRNELTDYLERKGVETRNLFGGNLTRQPAFCDIKMRIAGGLENTDLIMENTFFIGVYPGLAEAHIDYMMSRFDEFLRT